jgi:hypothetical protein
MRENIIVKAILKINPNAEVSVSSEDINTIVWENGTSPIPVSTIQDKVLELETEYNAKEYQRNRAETYKPLAEQLDMQYHDVQDGTETWLDHIKEVKAKYPKGDK